MLIKSEMASHVKMACKVDPSVLQKTVTVIIVIRFEMTFITNGSDRICHEANQTGYGPNPGALQRPVSVIAVIHASIDFIA